MTETLDPNLDLTLSRVIKAPRSAIWQAWADPARFAQWWVPAPARCRVVAMELRPGGAFETHVSEDGGAFLPQVLACFLEVIPGERIVFTDTLLGGWRPAADPFLTAIITLREHSAGTEYAAHVMHKSDVDRAAHETMGFFEGWGTVMAQLADLVEQPAS